MKKCTKCGVEKPTSEFHRQVSRRDGLRSWCKACEGQLRREYRAKNVEKIKASMARWREANSEHCLNYGRRYLTEHRDEKINYKRTRYAKEGDRLRAERREYYHSDPLHRKKSLDKAKQWMKEHPERTCLTNQATRARSLGCEGKVTVEQWLALCEMYDHHCLACGEQAPLTIDHIVPLTRGGSHSIENIQPLCKSCNSKKKQQVIDYRPDKADKAQELAAKVETLLIGGR